VFKEGQKEREKQLRGENKRKRESKEES